MGIEVGQRVGGTAEVGQRAAALNGAGCAPRGRGTGDGARQPGMEAAPPEVAERAGIGGAVKVILRRELMEVAALIGADN